MQALLDINNEYNANGTNIIQSLEVQQGNNLLYDFYVCYDIANETVQYLNMSKSELIEIE